MTTTSSRAGKFESRFFHKVLLLHRMRPCILQYLYKAHDVSWYVHVLSGHRRLAVAWALLPYSAISHT